MSGMEEKPFAPAEDATCFVARTSAWDPFIIYLVDPSKPSASHPNQGTEEPNPHVGSPHLPQGYPRAPANALPVNASTGPVPIYYNQPIVLQCLSTAVVSPVMVIRKVDKGSTATGGASLDGSSGGAGSGPRDVPVAPGEVIGDPVSQLHKIALEVMADPEAAYAAPPTFPATTAGFPGSGSFLACLGENVGVHRAESGRVPVAASSLVSPPSSASSMRSFGMMTGCTSTSREALAEAAYMANQLTQPLHHSNASSVRARSVTPAGSHGGQPMLQDPNALDHISSDGGKVRRVRRVSGSTGTAGGRGVGPAKAASRRRAGSISSNGGYDDFGSESSDGHHLYPAHHIPNAYPHASHAHPSGSSSAAQALTASGQAKLWTIECGEPAVWTIVGCDVERHTFWVPPVLLDSKPSSSSSALTASGASTISEVFRTPIPWCPIGYDTPTPIPVVHRYLFANPVSVASKVNKNGMENQELQMIS